jgi:hypothetical protein
MTSYAYNCKMAPKKTKTKKFVEKKVKDMSRYKDGVKITNKIEEIVDRTPDRNFVATHAVRENEDGVLVWCEKINRAEMEKSVNDKNERRRREHGTNYSRVVFSKSELYISSRLSDYSGPLENLVEVFDRGKKAGILSDNCSSESSSDGVGGGNAKKGSLVRGSGKRKRGLYEESTSSDVSGKGGKAKKHSSGDDSYVDSK